VNCEGLAKRRWGGGGSRLRLVVVESLLGGGASIILVKCLLVRFFLRYGGLYDLVGVGLEAKYPNCCQENHQKAETSSDNKPRNVVESGTDTTNSTKRGCNQDENQCSPRDGCPNVYVILFHCLPPKNKIFPNYLGFI